MRLRFVAIIAIAISLVACGGQADPGNASEPHGAEPRAAGSSEVLASGHGVTVTERDVWLELELLPDSNRRALARDEAAFRNLVSEIYYRRRMQLLGDEMGYTDDPLVRAQLRREQERVLMDLVPQRYHDELEVPDMAAAAREDYEANPERYTPEREIRVAHILLRAPSEEARAQRRPEAEALHERLRAGEAFGDLAREYGEDGTRAHGGDLGFFASGRMVPEFEEAAFALENIGDLDLVETRHGLHLIRLLDREGGEPTPFAEVESWIKNKLEREYRQEATVQWLRSVASPRDAAVDHRAVDSLFSALRAEQGVIEPLPADAGPEATEATEPPPEATTASDAPAAQP